MTIQSSDFGTLRQYIGPYAQELYTGSADIYNTGIMQEVQFVDPSRGYDGIIGTERWHKDAKPVINTPEESATDITASDRETASGRWVKYMRSISHDEDLVQRVLTHQNGLMLFGNTLARGLQDIMNGTIFTQLNGFAASQIAGGTPQVKQEWDRADGVTFWYDAGNATVKSATKVAGNSGKLINTAGTTKQAQLAPLYAAMNKLFKGRQKSQPFIYLLCDLDTYTEILSASQIDYRTFMEANFEVTSILDGRLRLVPTNAQDAGTSEIGTTASSIVSTYGFKDYSGETNVVTASKKTSFFLFPGAIRHQRVAVYDAMTNAEVLEPLVDLYFDPRKGKGGGRLSMVAKMAAITSIYGINWTTASTVFPGMKGAGTNNFQNTSGTLAGSWSLTADIATCPVGVVTHA